MIHRFSFSNFYSFKKTTDISLEVDQNAPSSDAYFDSGLGKRLSKVLVVLGPNASGKTSLLRALPFIRWFVTYSFSDQKPEEEIPFKPFKFCSSTEPTAFETDFQINKNLYKYKLAISNTRVLSEQLSVKSIQDKKFNRIFLRKYDSEKQSYTNKFSKSFNVPASFSKILRDNCSVLSAGVQINNRTSIDIIKYFDNLYTDVAEIGKLPSRPRLQQVIKHYHENPDLKEKMEDILKRFDLGVSRLDIRKVENEQTSSYLPLAFHKNIDSSEETPLLLDYESSGTISLVILLQIILSVLKTGGIAILDEMDNDLHPMMLPEIINLFTSCKHNRNNAQLLFSTHSTQLLSHLDKQQVVLVEKNNDGTSTAWKLSDIKGVRIDENLFAKYTAGAYGATPHL